jgi:hypothetical protein
MLPADFTLANQLITMIYGDIEDVTLQILASAAGTGGREWLQNESLIVSIGV